MRASRARARRLSSTSRVSRAITLPGCACRASRQAARPAARCVRATARPRALGRASARSRSTEPRGAAAGVSRAGHGTRASTSRPALRRAPVAPQRFAAAGAGPRAPSASTSASSGAPRSRSSPRPRAAARPRPRRRGREAHDLAAREHGGRQRAQLRQDQHDHGTSGRLLQHLQEGLGRGRRSSGRPPSTMKTFQRRLEGPERRPALQLADRSPCGWPAGPWGSSRAAWARSRGRRGARRAPCARPARPPAGATRARAKAERRAPSARSPAGPRRRRHGRRGRSEAARREHADRRRLVRMPRSGRASRRHAAPQRQPRTRPPRRRDVRARGPRRAGRRRRTTHALARRAAISRYPCAHAAVEGRAPSARRRRAGARRCAPCPPRGPGRAAA